MKKIIVFLALCFWFWKVPAQEYTYRQFLNQDYPVQAREVHDMIKEYRDVYVAKNGDSQTPVAVTGTAFLDFLIERYPENDCRGGNACSLNYNFQKYARFTDYGEDISVYNLFDNFVRYLYSIGAVGENWEDSNYENRKELMTDFISLDHKAETLLYVAVLEEMKALANYLQALGLYPNISFGSPLIEAFYSDFQLMIAFNYSMGTNSYKIIFNPRQLREPRFIQKEKYWLVNLSCATGSCFTVQIGKSEIKKPSIQLKSLGEYNSDISEQFKHLKAYSEWSIEKDYFNY